MTATTINTKTTPTAEAIQEALAFLRNLSEKNAAESGEKTDSVFNFDIIKTIEAALKNVAEAKEASVGKDASDDEEEETAQTKRRAAHAVSRDEEDEEEEDIGDEDDEEDDDNPFAGEYYWNPGPEWKTIGLVAGGAALVGLGALLYKLFDD